MPHDVIHAWRGLRKRYCGFVRRLRNNTAQSLVLFVKLGVRYLAALRLALEIDTYRV